MPKDIFNLHLVERNPSYMYTYRYRYYVHFEFNSKGQGFFVADSELVGK